MKLYKRLLCLLLLFSLLLTLFSFTVSANVSEIVDPVIDLGDSFIRFKTGTLIRNQTYYNPDFGVVNSDNNSISVAYKVSSSTTYAVESYATFEFYGHNYGTLTITLEMSSGTAYDQGGYIQANGSTINYTFTTSGNKYTFIITGNIPRTFEIGAVYFNATPELVNSNNYLVTLYSNASFVPDYSNMSEEIISNQNQNTQDIIDNQKEQTNKISGFISNLGDRIGGFFTDLKDNLINGIKDLFVPDEQFMTDYSDTWKTLLSERLGAVYQVINVIDESWKSVRQADLQDSIEIPVVNIPLPDDNEFSFGGYSVRVVPEGFEFLGTAIKTVTSMVLVIMFIQGLRWKYDEVITK